MTAFLINFNTYELLIYCSNFYKFGIEKCENSEFSEKFAISILLVYLNFPIFFGFLQKNWDTLMI